MLYCIRPNIVLFSYSAFGWKSVLLNQLSSYQLSYFVLDVGPDSYEM